jgi:hypothetical protein
MRRSVIEIIEKHRSSGRVFHAGGVRSFALEKGGGAPVVCLHGVPTSSFVYRKLVPELSQNGLRGIAFGGLVAAAAVLVAPALAAVALLAEQGGPFVTPFESAADRALTQADIARAVRTAQGSMTAITSLNAGTAYPAATYT